MSRESGRLPAPVDKTGFSNLLVKLEPQIADVLPNEQVRRRFVKLTQVAAARAPKLFQCTSESLSLAIMTAAELRLDFSGVTGQCWINPFFNSKIGQYEAVFMSGWKGLRDLVYYGNDANPIKITGLRAVTVRENDDYGFVDLDPETLRERAWHTKAQGDRGAVKAAYCTWAEGGVQHVEWMWFDDLEKRRQCSQVANGPAWKKWPDEMYAKTVEKFAIDKRIPITFSTRLSIAAAVRAEYEKLGVLDIEGESVVDLPPEGRTSRDELTSSADPDHTEPTEPGLIE